MPNDDQANECLERCQNIVAELVSALRMPGDPARPEAQACRMAADVYLFLYRTLADVRLKRDRKKLDEVLQILEIERGTWQTVCDRSGLDSGPDFELDMPQDTRERRSWEEEDLNVPASPLDVDHADDGHGFSWRA